MFIEVIHIRVILRSKYYGGGGGSGASRVFENFPEFKGGDGGDGVAIIYYW